MIVTCSSCAARYALPEELLGPAGARVRCPRCSERFVVAPPAGETATRWRAATVPDSEAKGPSTLDPARADAALDALDARLGSALFAAHTRGRLFTDHGPALLEAFDAYRSGSDRPDPAAAFRAAIRRRWGIDLEGGTRD